MILGFTIYSFIYITDRVTTISSYRKKNKTIHGFSVSTKRKLFCSAWTLFTKCKFRLRFGLLYTWVPPDIPREVFSQTKWPCPKRRLRLTATARSARLSILHHWQMCLSSRRLRSRSHNFGHGFKERYLSRVLH